MTKKSADKDFQATLDYLYGNLPMFQRMGGAAFKKDLSNTWELCEHLGNPQNAFRSVHIAGTNGKGSTSHFLAGILSQAGYKTGLYTSPHLKSFTERIRINGTEIDKGFVVDFVSENRAFIDRLKPSFFEITVAMAFSYFAREKVDIAVIEVGMGGRLDSTNVITPLVSVITNIGLDHQQWLGDSLEKIAVEKGGIIKPDVPVVLSEFNPVTTPVLREIAENRKAPVYEADQLQSFSSTHDNWIFQSKEGAVVIPAAALPGYQQRNIKGVIQAVNLLGTMGFIITGENIISGITRVGQLTGLRGRWQQLYENPDVFCDVGHNTDGVKLLLEQINTRRFRKLYLIWGMVNDKEIGDVLDLLPRDAHYVFCEANIPRAMPGQELHRRAQEYGLAGIVIKDPREALEFCKNEASPDDLIVVGGSNFVVAELDLPD